MLNVTSSFWQYLDKQGERWTILLPFLAFFGTITTLIVDYIIYVVDKNKDINPLWMDHNRRTWFGPIASAMFERSFLPLGYLGKLVHDTFKPFKYNFAFEFGRSFQQPFEGVALILTGLWRVITSPLQAIVKVLLDTFILIGKPSNPKYYFVKVGTHLLEGMIGFINGISRLVAGAVELALTPFTWTLKPLIRFAIGAMLDVKDKPNVVNNDGIQKRIAVANTQQHISESQSTYRDIHRKFIKSVARGEAVNADVVTEEARLFELLGTHVNNVDEYRETANSYVRLFAQKPVNEADVADVQQQQLLISNSI